MFKCEIGSVVDQLVKKDKYPSIMITAEQRSATFCLGFSTLDQALEWRSMAHQVFQYNDAGRRFWYAECRIALSCTSPTEVNDVNEFHSDVSTNQLKKSIEIGQAVDPTQEKVE